ncbi:MAG TPA: HlyD family efflux transporter periplasmic adaptor subunit [Longimicrobiales bacterium]|nr:HlyD family efflux transporter periplasmic adaptor subunit [Longimicrobiales bacterium]
MKRRALVPLAVVAVVVIAGITAVTVLRDADGRTDTLVASGTVEATDADIGFQTSGRIVAIDVREGDRVEAGAPLARLDASELEARLDAARAQVAMANAQLSELRRGPRSEDVAQARAAETAAMTRLEDARRELERARTLFDGGAISRQAFERALSAERIAQSQHDQAREQVDALETGTRPERIEAAQGGLDHARAAVRQIETLIGNAIITAPFAGIVTVRHREPGEVVSAGLPVVTLMDPDDRWVRIYIGQASIGRMTIGQVATITSDADPGREYEGEIMFIASEAEFTPRAVQTPEERTRLVHAVKVRILGDGGDLKPGVSADVHVR